MGRLPPELLAPFLAAADLSYPAVAEEERSVSAA
jgi:hypothetical protein